MSTISHPVLYPTLEKQPREIPLYTRFLNWTRGQENNRFLWLGIALAGHGCFLTPFTISAALLAGLHFGFVIAALAAMAMALVSNLAALPTKITIPVFIVSILADIAIILISILAILS